MHKYKDYLRHIEGDAEKLRKLEEVMCEAVEKIKKHCPNEFWDTMYDIHCVVYGEHFDEQLAKMAVEKMHNVDGTTGEFWTMEQTNQLANQYDIKEKCDFYYVMNMMHSDYSHIIGNDTAMYAKFAKAYMCDPDAKEGKAFHSWWMQHKHKK